MTANNVQTAKAIYEALKVLGLTRAQVRRLLPAWWEPAMEQTADGVAELCLIVSRRLDVDFASLSQGVVARKDAKAQVAYKHATGADVGSLQAATCVATSLAQAVLAALPTTRSELPASPKVLATRCKELGSGMVSLASMVEACWQLGVPVIPLPNLPVGVRKMDGAVIKVGDRPAIVISKKKSSRAWLGFILAHEIGHLAKGHLNGSGSIIDVSLQEQATYETESGADNQEREADEFALALLGGERVESTVSKWSPQSSPTTLAVYAKTSAAACGVEPGHLVLRFAFKTKRWAEAMIALNYLQEDANAELVMQAGLKRHLDLDRVADDMRDFIVQVTGIQA